MNMSSRNIEGLIKEASSRKLTSGQSRNVVHYLIEKGSDHKMVSCETLKAIELLEKAEKICDVYNDRISEPWPSVIAYRKAHLLMRLCSKPENHEKSEIVRFLKEADELFTKASRRANLLGPLPSIYRLAVLHRIRMITGDNLDYMIKSAYIKAVDRFSTWASESSDCIWGMSGNSSPSIRRSENSDKNTIRLQLQNGYFNMLELASYFLAQPYDILEGRGILPDMENDILNGKGWVVISPDPQTCKVQVSREMAIEEAQEMSRNDPGSVVFILSHNASEEKKIMWKYGNGEWIKVNYESLRLLAFLCAMKEKTSAELRNKFRPGAGASSELQDEDAYNAGVIYRTTKSRLKGRFQKLTGVSPSEVFAEETPTGIPIIHTEINIYGAVEKSVLGNT